MVKQSERLISQTLTPRMERERGREKAESQKSTVSSGWSNSQNLDIFTRNNRVRKWREERGENPRIPLSQVDGPLAEN